MLQTAARNKTVVGPIGLPEGVDTAHSLWSNQLVDGGLLGVPDLVQHGQTGYLAGERDAEDLATGLRPALEQPATIRDWGRAAPEAVL